KDSEPSSFEDEKTLKKKRKGKGKGPSKTTLEKPLKKKTKGKGKGPRLPIGGISLYDLPERRKDDEFVQRWLSQFAPKKKK
nr:hypothetical protein [Tanacetum cinerariifolium]